VRGVRNESARLLRDRGEQPHHGARRQPAAPSAAVTPAILTDDLDGASPTYDAAPTGRTGTPSLIAWSENGSTNIRIGYVDQSALHELYAGARVLVMPSFEEGFGIPVLEAMTAGVPVVASNRGSLPEVLGDAGLLIDPERAEDLASALDRMVGDDALAQECATRGVERARRFSWRETAAQVMDVYRQAVERRTGAHRH